MILEMKRERGLFRIFVDGRIKSSHKFKQAVPNGDGYTCIEEGTGDRCRVYIKGEKVVVDYMNGTTILI